MAAQPKRAKPSTAKPNTAKPSTIDEYLESVSDDQRAALEKLRQAIRKAAPKAQEYIGYGLAAFKLDGQPLVAFGAVKGHCAFYPMSGSTVKDHAADLKEYETSKGTIRFLPTRPLKATLIKKLVAARIQENGARNAKKAARPKQAAQPKQAARPKKAKAKP